MYHLLKHAKIVCDGQANIVQMMGEVISRCQHIYADNTGKRNINRGEIINLNNKHLMMECKYHKHKVIFEIHLLCYSLGVKCHMTKVALNMVKPSERQNNT